MDPGRPPRPERSYAGGPAAYRGEASSPSSPRPPPPQQQHRARVDAPRSAMYGYGSSSSSSPRLPPPPPPPPQKQQQGHAIQPVGLPQPSAVPFGSGPPVPGPTPPPLHPQFGSQQDPYWWWSGGYLTMVDAGTAARNFEGNTRPIPCYPYHSPLGPTVWGPTSNTSQYLDAVVAQQMSAAPSWPQQPQFGPRFVPQPLQPPPTHQDWRLVEIRSELLRSPTTALEQVVMSPDPEYSAILVHQLNVGDEEMRKMVLDGFKHCAREIMGNRQGHAVFEALLRSFYGEYLALQIIVETAVKPNLVPRSDDGVYSLELLITAVAWLPPLCSRLVDSFMDESVMDDVGGDKLILRCFTTMPNYVTSALVNNAIGTIDDRTESPSGSTFLATCFRYAANCEALPRFQTIILAKAVAMAKKRSGKYFVLHLLDNASIEAQFRRQLASKLMENVLHLSLNGQGQFVVEHCFLSKETWLLNIALGACAELTHADLQILLTHRASRNLVPHLLHMLLEDGNTHFPEIAKVLVWKFEGLSLRIREYDDLKPLMSAARSVLADNLPN